MHLFLLSPQKAAFRYFCGDPVSVHTRLSVGFAFFIRSANFRVSRDFASSPRQSTSLKRNFVLFAQTPEVSLDSSSFPQKVRLRLFLRDALFCRKLFLWGPQIYNACLSDCSIFLFNFNRFRRPVVGGADCVCNLRGLSRLFLLTYIRAPYSLIYLFRPYLKAALSKGD